MRLLNIKSEMLKNFYLLFAIYFFTNFWAQTNNHILYNSGVQVPDVIYYCSGETFDVKVNAVASSTGSYTMNAVPTFNIASPITHVPFSDKNGNNRFSLPLNLGFTFDFYGTKYTQVVVGSNGRLVFSNGPELANLNDHSQYLDRVHSGNTASSSNIKLPSPEYNKVNVNPATTVNLAQIFAAYTDIGYYAVNDYNKITYGTTNYGGVPGMIISFSRVVELTSGYSSVVTSQILLLSDNRYFVKIIEKTKATQNAIIGAQNETGTRAVWPVNNSATSVYNNGQWSHTSGVLAYEFVPSETLIPKIEWLQNGTAIPGATTNNLNYTPTNISDQLEVRISYLNSSGTPVGPTESSYVTYNKIQPVQISAPVYGTGCAAPATLSIISPDPNLIYEWYDASTGSVIKTNAISVDVASGSYYAKAKSSLGAFCGHSSTQTVTITTSVPPFLNNGKTILNCDNLGLPSNTFDLLSLSGYSLGTGYTVEFLENGSVIADSNLGYNILLTSGTPRNISIRVMGSTGCNVSGTFTVSYLSFPPIGKVYTAKTFCSDKIRYQASEFKSEFLPGTNYDIKFSTDGGINFNQTEINPKIHPSVQVKLTYPGFTCESVGTLNFNYHPEVTANTPDPTNPDLIQCASSTQTYDLPALFNHEINPSPNVTITYYRDLADAQSGTNAISNPETFRSGMDYTTLYIRVVDNTTGCVAASFPSVTLFVHARPKILVSNPIVKTNCANNTLFDLTQDVSSLTDAASPVTVSAEYYSQNGTLLTLAEVAAYDAAAFGTKPYIKLIYNSTCDAQINFDLKYNPLPTSLITALPVCGESSITLTDLKAKAIANPTNYTFSDTNGNPLPATISWSALPYVLNFVITDNATGCKSTVQTITFDTGNPTPVISTVSDFVDCDTDDNQFDGIRLFDLDAKKTAFTTDNTAVFKYFKDAALTQPISSNYINEVPFAQTIYAEVTGTGYCPVTVQINLKVNSPTKSSTLEEKYLICYGEQVFVDAGAENTSWRWNDGSNSQTKIFTEPGNYSVELTNADNCSYVHHFIISAENQPVIEQINQDDARIEVVAAGGVQPYEYSFDGGSTWQVSNILLNPTLPEYHIQVRSTVAPGVYCEGEIKSIYTITVNNVITPNGDGINDYWTINNLDKMQQVELVVTDRYGKEVFRNADQSSLKWDGKSNGRQLPSASYWYFIKWHDPSTKKDEVRNGWILLKNRD